MSNWHLERALYQLSKDKDLVNAFRRDPKAALPAIQLDSSEIALITDCDVVAMYRRDVHPNLIRNFSATVGVDYVARYREAGL